MKAKFFAVPILCFLISSNLAAQWIKTNGPVGITIKSLLNKDDLLFAGTESKGIYKSADHGLTWTESNIQATKNVEVYSLAFDNSYLYAGTLQNGVYASSNNGGSWHFAGLPDKAVYCMVVANGYLFAGTIGSGIFRSPDNGTTWEDINQNLLTHSSVWAMVYQNNRLIIEAGNYIFYSVNNGDSWGIDQGTTAFYRIENFFHHGDTLLASAGSTVFRSVNGGVSWGNPIFLNDALFGFDHIGDTIYAGYKYGVVRSVDWGLTWTTISSTDMRYGSRFQHKFIISGNNFINGFEEIGAYVSTDKGLNWTQAPLSAFSRSASIDDAMINVNGAIITGTHSDGVYRTLDKGDTWSRIGTPVDTDTLSNEIVFSMMQDGSNLLAGSCGDALFRSQDNGNSWTRIIGGLPQESITGYTCIKSLARSGPNLIAALTEGVYYSADGGLSWHPSVVGGATDPYASGIAVRGNIVCIGIIASLSSGIYRSTDNGQTFTLAAPILDVQKLVAGGGTQMYAGSFDGAYVSDDDGITWSSMGPNIASGVFTLLAWDHFVAVGNTDGVFFSSNNGLSFTDISQGFDPNPNNAVQGLTMDNEFMYAGMYKNAVWKRPLSEFITILPVTIGPLKAQAMNAKTIVLSWETFTEVNVKGFEIERSINSVDFATAGYVTATGNSNLNRTYRFEDKNPFAGINYYRLKVTDYDGKSTYTNIASARISGNGIISIKPNPFKDKITILVSGLEKEQMQTRLFDGTGRLIQQQHDVLHSGIMNIELNGLANLQPGVYLLEVTIDGKKNVYKLIK